ILDAGNNNDLRLVNSTNWFFDSGIIQHAGHIELGNGSGTPALEIAAGANLFFTTDDGGIVDGGGGNMINAGFIAKTGGTGTSVIGVPFTNAATAVVTAGIGALKLSGDVSGTGTLRIDAASP